LAEHEIWHEREPAYVDAAYKADWLIRPHGREVFIELFGMDGVPAYSKRMKAKIAHAESVGMTMVAFDKNDLKDLRSAFRKKILPLFSGVEFIKKRS
jgi:hypothetical protein